jgi:hypothetical protein
MYTKNPQNTGPFEGGTAHRRTCDIDAAHPQTISQAPQCSAVLEAALKRTVGTNAKQVRTYALTPPHRKWELSRIKTDHKVLQRETNFEYFLTVKTRAGRSGNRIPVGTKFCVLVQTGSLSHQASYTQGNRSVFRGVKRSRRGVYYPHPPSADAAERVELYLYSPSGPSWRVLGRSLLLHLPFYGGHSYPCMLSRNREIKIHKNKSLLYNFYRR